MPTSNVTVVQLFDGTLIQLMYGEMPFGGGTLTTIGMKKNNGTLLPITSDYSELEALKLALYWIGGGPEVDGKQLAPIKSVISTVKDLG
jgi:hypothetical protein